MSDAETARPPEFREEAEPFSNAELGAMAHLYRGEIYRSTIWRTRLDATTNWSVVSLGIALSISYASPQASALPLYLVVLLIAVFLHLEARRYRYFNVWRARARWIETHFYSPLLRRQPYDQAGWKDTLAEDYERPQHHISFARALGRRLRRNYLWIFCVQQIAFFGKIIIHPEPVEDFGGFLRRMAMGPIPGWFTFTLSLLIVAAVFGFTWRMRQLDRERFRKRPTPYSMG